MVYKKYIKRGGKLYGPYIYHSKRVDGKVVSEYHGSKNTNYKKFFLIGVAGLVFITLIYIALTSHTTGTGNAVLNLNANYQQGQPLSGKLSLSLQQGELIPADSKVILDNNGKNTEYSLSNFVSDQTQNGSFYVSGSSLSGYGAGYGIPGQKITYPTIQFTLNILSKNQSQETNSTNLTSQENQTSSNSSSYENNSNTSVTGNAVSGILNQVGDLFLGLTPTGNAVIEYQSQIQGSVSSGKNFTYELQPGQSAELNPLSVFLDGKQLPDNTVHIQTIGNQVVVTTNYSELSSGFGQNYTGTQTKDILIDLSKMNYTADPGTLNISLTENGNNIVSLGTTLQSGNIAANETAPKPSSNTNENYSVPKNNLTVQTQNLPPVQNNLELTSQEKDILKNKFGNYTVKVESAIQRDGYLVVRYDIGKYWIEDSYPANLDPATLQSYMQQDVIKWQKDLAARFSTSDQSEGQNVTGLIGNFSG